MPRKWWYRASLTCPACRTSPPYFPPLRLPVFGWLLCEPLLIDGCLRPWCILCLFTFCPSIRRTKRWNGVSPCALPPTRLRSNIPIIAIASANSRLIIVCHHPEPRPSLCFSMHLFSAPQTGKPAIAPPNPNMGALRGNNRKQRRHWLVAPTACPWRERANAAEG